MNTYELITNRIIEKMEQGHIPWRKPWTFQAPRNFVSKRPYHGINFLLLTLSEQDTPYWLTFNQAKQLGGSIKKGERGTPVIFWKLLEVLEKTSDSEENKAKSIPYLQHFTVFNLRQTDGIAMPKEAIQHLEPLTACKRIVEDFTNKPQAIHTLRPQAYYQPSADIVHMPSISSFTSFAEYYATLFHEYVHATGHEKRLNRQSQGKMNVDFGSKEYSREELIAELGSAFLCARAHIDNSVIENSAAYLQSWLSVFQQDKKILIHASAKASKAAAYILGDNEESKPEGGE